MPNIIIHPPVFHQEEIIVADEGEHVLVKIGNSELRFPYEDALKIAQLIRIHAKRAKRLAGDNSRHWSAIASIENMKL